MNPENPNQSQPPTPTTAERPSNIKRIEILIYFFIALGFIGGLTAFDFSAADLAPEIVHVVITGAISLLLGWLIMRSLRKRLRDTVVLPVLLVAVNLFGLVYEVHDGSFVVDFATVIFLLELFTLLAMVVLLKTNQLRNWYQ